MILDEEMVKVRKILWKKFDNIIPDETVKLMIHSFKLMAKIIIKNLEKENKKKSE